MADLTVHDIHPLLCDVETGICKITSSEVEPNNNKVDPSEKPIKIIYYTDPICSSCWGIEPQLRKLKLEYGHILEFDYRMGGLLPDWSYNSGGINRPADVAHHWDEVSIYYDMPIDGNVWLEDPLSSSYPPSIAIKAAEIQNKEKAIVMLRVLRELLFLRKKNITRWEFIIEAASKAGLDIDQLRNDVDGKAKQLFAEDLELAQTLGVRGFPTLFFADQSGIQEKVYGFNPYSVFENVVLKLQPLARQTKYGKDWSSLFSTYPTLTTREFTELSGISRPEAELLLEQLNAEGDISRILTKNGSMWYK